VKLEKDAGGKSKERVDRKLLGGPVVVGKAKKKKTWDGVMTESRMAQNAKNNHAKKIMRGREKGDSMPSRGVKRSGAA